MADAVVIQVAGETAGIAVADDGGYRFYASSHSYNKLDNTVHRSVRAVLVAARHQMQRRNHATAGRERRVA